MTFDNQFQWLNTDRNHPLPAWWRMPMFRTGFSQGNNTLEHSDQKCERKENAERVFYCNHILPKGGEVYRGAQSGNKNTVVFHKINS
jgi:hypothetical protein